MLRRLFLAKPTWIIILGVLAAYFRIVAVQETRVDNPIRADARDYYLSAYNLTHHGVYSHAPDQFGSRPTEIVPDAYRFPGLPLIISAFMSLWPQHEQILNRVLSANLAPGIATVICVLLVNVALGIATVILSFLAASMILPLPAAIAAGLLTACSPHLISMTTYVLTETPAAFFASLPLAIVAVKLSEDSKIQNSGQLFIAIGACVGCLSLFRPVFLAFTPLTAIAFLCRPDKWRALIFSCGGAALIVAPWFIRNLLNVPAGGPSLVADTMLRGSYRGYTFAANPSTFPDGWLYDPSVDFTRRSLVSTLEAVGNKITLDPLGMMKWYFVEKPVYLFQWSNIDGIGDVFVYPIVRTPFSDRIAFKAVHLIFEWSHVVILTLAFLGCIAPWTPAVRKIISSKAKTVLRLASLMLIFLYFIHLPFFVAGRYAVPLYPVIFLLAVSAIYITWKIGQNIMIHQPHLTRSCGGQAPTADRTVAQG